MSGGRGYSSASDSLIFKSGDVNNPSNYRTIMINPLFAKLFGNMAENRISKWAEVKEKREKDKRVLGRSIL